MRPRIDSEIGPLRHVITHRPGRELDRLTPSNIHSLLFDDVPWAARARDEHDQFVEVLASRGATVYRFAELLAGALDTGDGRQFVLERTCTPERFGVQMARTMRRLLDYVDGATLAELLIGGVLKSDIDSSTPAGLRWEAFGLDELVLPPLPNTLFQRDNSAWIGSGVTVNPMAKLARQRESVHSRAVYRYHPLFRDTDFDVYYGDDDRDHRPATLEGGDLLVLAPGVVLLGMGERTTAPAVELLSHRLFAAGQAHTVVALDIPRSRATMHLDTVLTMVDVATFVVYPHLDLDTLRAWRITPARTTGRRCMSRLREGCRAHSPTPCRWTRCTSCAPATTRAPRNASSGATATTTSRSSRAWSSATTATWLPTRCSASTASRCSRSPVASSAAVAAARGA